MKPIYERNALRPCHECKKQFRGGPFSSFCDTCRPKRAFAGKPGRLTYEWTPEMDAVIRKHWKRGEVGRIPAALGWPMTTLSTIKRRAALIGLPTLVRSPDEARPWTKEETDFLEEHASSKTVWWISHHIGRSERAVTLKIHRLGMSSRVQAADGYTLDDLSRAMGECPNTIRRWAAAGYFGAMQFRYGENEPAYERDPRIVSPAQVLAFVKRHPTLFRLDRVDQVWFLDLVFNRHASEKEQVA